MIASNAKIDAQGVPYDKYKHKKKKEEEEEEAHISTKAGLKTAKNHESKVIHRNATNHLDAAVSRQAFSAAEIQVPTLWCLKTGHEASSHD